MIQPEKAQSVVPCPTCKKSIQWNAANTYRPFCSERCKLIDLGAWASEQHAIAGEPAHLMDDTDAEFYQSGNDY